MPRYNLGILNEYYIITKILKILKNYFIFRLKKENYYNEFYTLKISKGKDISFNEIF